jgi:hypothetical protein
MPRKDLPTNLEISCVLPPNFPLTLSRSDLVCVALGSIAYSLVTQPSPFPTSHLGTPGVNDATHKTLVLPNSTSTEPSALSNQLRVNLIGLN